MVAAHFSNFQFFTFITTFFLYTRHAGTNVENSLFYYITYKFLQLLGMEMAVVGVLTILLHFRYEYMLQKIWRVADKASGYNFLEYIPLLNSINIFNRVKFFTEVMFIGIISSIMYQAIPFIHTFVNMAQSPYYGFRVSPKPKLRLL